MRYLCNNTGGGGLPSPPVVTPHLALNWRSLHSHPEIFCCVKKWHLFVSLVTEGFPRPASFHTLFSLQHYKTGLQKSATRLRFCTFHLLLSRLVKSTKLASSRKQLQGQLRCVSCVYTGKPFVFGIFVSTPNEVYRKLKIR